MAEIIFHIVALVWLAFFACIWSSNGLLNCVIKFAVAGSAAFAAVIVAKDWFA